MVNRLIWPISIDSWRHKWWLWLIIYLFQCVFARIRLSERCRTFTFSPNAVPIYFDDFPNTFNCFIQNECYIPFIWPANCDFVFMIQNKLFFPVKLKIWNRWSGCNSGRLKSLDNNSTPERGASLWWTFLRRDKFWSSFELSLF